MSDESLHAELEYLKRSNVTMKSENKVVIALAVMAAMREHRKGKISFEWPTRWSDPTYLGDGPWGA